MNGKKSGEMEMAETQAKDYYKELINRWQKRIEEINSSKELDAESRAEWDVLEEVIFEVTLGLMLFEGDKK